MLNMKYLMFEKKRLISEKEWLMLNMKQLMFEKECLISAVRDRMSEKKYPINGQTSAERLLYQ